MQILNVVLSSVGSVIALFLLAKLMGNKQISELNVFDYIIGITIGSIAAEMATSLEGDFLLPLIAMVIYALAAVLTSLLSSKSVKMRKLLTGKSIVLMENGKLYKKNFKSVHLDIAEFLSQCRINGFFDLNDIETAIFETNGKISFLPKAEKRPINPQDLSLKPQKEKPCITLVTDGHILSENLHYCGKDEQWLKKEMQRLGIKRFEDIFLATTDNNDKLTAFVKLSDKPQQDLYQ